MARPIKQGVDYFPLDVHLDDKFKFVEIKYKLEGFAVVVKLMQRIYSQGYWCKWTEDEALLFSDEIKADFDLVQNVVNECVKRDVFNKELFEQHEILTSKGIQKRYKEIVRRRKGVEVTEEYLLIDGDFGINESINDSTSGVNDDINPSLSKHDDGKSTQTKVNKTKVNKTEKKIKYAEFVSMQEKEFNKLVEQYGESTTMMMIETLNNYKGSKGKTYKNDYRAILSWVVDKFKQEKKLNIGEHKKQNYYQPQEKEVTTKRKGKPF